MTITRNTGTSNQNHRTETAYVRQQCLFFPKNLESANDVPGAIRKGGLLVRPFK